MRRLLFAALGLLQRWEKAQPRCPASIEGRAAGDHNCQLAVGHDGSHECCRGNKRWVDSDCRNVVIGIAGEDLDPGEMLRYGADGKLYRAGTGEQN
jgi:hypothetical protein